eukprot:TRINITY_DN48266_c0_g1_i1.p1 TRINITY_DN48266_c0_g1~~TRINITY_DN48266_c0_g1_i1.p1  ORF type:complete len:513 (-),score=77.04 TRINITY_DN48266_c0_g1_i1:49-1482(-)
MATLLAWSVDSQAPNAFAGPAVSTAFANHGDNDAPTDNSSGLILGIVLAVAGGSASALGANILAWYMQQEVLGHAASSCRRKLYYLICLILNLAGVGMFAAACAFGGAVATVMPIQTGSNLMTNMLCQIGFGIKFYDKQMRVGTLVLACAVAELVQLGPRPPAKQDVLALISEPMAIAWCVFLVLCCVAAIASSIFTMKRPTDSVSKLFSFTAVVSLTTVIGSSLSKCFSLLHGTALIAAIAIYFVDGLACMGFTLLANAGCDVSIYIPLQLSSQLLINMATGMMVWNDLAYTSNLMSYLMVYAISILAVYLISADMDGMGIYIKRRGIMSSLLSRSRASTKFGAAVLRVADMWNDMANEADLEITPEAGAARCKLIEDALVLGMEKHALSSKDILGLVMALLREQHGAPSLSIIEWIETLPHVQEYAKRDPDFLPQLRGYHEQAASSFRSKASVSTSAFLDRDRDRLDSIQSIDTI